MNKLFFIWIVLLLLNINTDAQINNLRKQFTKADTLRGTLSPLRTCYDINFYHLDVKIDIDQRHLTGSNVFAFTATTDFNRLQFDLFAKMKVQKVIYKGKEIAFTRAYDAVFVTFPTTIKKGSKDQFKVYYSGFPLIAKNPPWDGGLIFSKDKNGKPWVSVACQGLGASSWWPNKDHQSDEVDSMLISTRVAGKLTSISNGRLRSIVNLADGDQQFNWFVSNPINNYNVTFYIGDYSHWAGEYQGEKGKLNLAYWALKEDSAKARAHWKENVKPMLKTFEHWFGPYPFYEDGYKLVQAPHLGMEHQSAVAYGNGFKNGYLGKDLSGSGYGADFDFIVIHESGHEWFGNNITAKDVADMWIHEGFTSYSEALYAESRHGKKASTAYIKGIRANILNTSPIIGQYGVNYEGSTDMYYKGANLVHLIRQLMNNDAKFREMLRTMNSDFYHQTVTTGTIESYLSEKSGWKLKKIFDQYLRHGDIPVLEYKINKGKLHYRWKAAVANFDMPLKIVGNSKQSKMIYPTSNWKMMPATDFMIAEGLKIDPNFYVGQQLVNEVLSAL